MFRFLFLVGIITTTVIAKPQAPNASPKCLPTALPQLTSAFTSCTDSIKFNLPTFSDVSDIPKFLTDFEKGAFDDKCFAKCLGDQLKLITPDNKLNRSEFAKVIKIANASEEFAKTLDKVWMTCADTVEAKMKDDKDGCKTAAMFAHCNLKALYAQKDTMPKC